MLRGTDCCVQDAMLADALFELASVVTATAGWNFRRAAYLCKDSRAGIDTQQAARVRPPRVSRVTIQAYACLVQGSGCAFEE